MTAAACAGKCDIATTVRPSVACMSPRRRTSHDKVRCTWQLGGSRWAAVRFQTRPNSPRCLLRCFDHRHRLRRCSQPCGLAASPAVADQPAQLRPCHLTTSNTLRPRQLYTDTQQSQRDTFPYVHKILHAQRKPINHQPHHFFANWSSVTPLPMALVELTPPLTIFSSSSA